MELYDYQIAAIRKMRNGCILCGGVGSGKSITSLAYYFLRQGGKIFNAGIGDVMKNPKDLYIITTAMKRDTHEWELELAKLNLGVEEGGYYHNKVVIDSWNNIRKYAGVERAFFIFDEQRVVGSGAWVKAFLKIARSNEWILLSATPGDTWSDYIPVFVANGFYKNRSEFIREHAVFNRYSTYPKIDRYMEEGRLLKYKREILVDMDFIRATKQHHIYISCEYDPMKFKELTKKRWNPWKDEPMQNAGELCYCMRRVCNEDESRIVKCLEIAEDHPKLIIFYNFDYELEILRSAAWEEGTVVAEWNGHKHDILPDGERWAYLVQYTAGAEGWNCITTNAMIFYSQSYSYRATVQAAGRIDRANTPFRDLFFYHLYSKSGIDLAIYRALKNKKEFNERRFLEGWKHE